MASDNIHIGDNITMRGGKGNTGKIESRMTIGSASAASLDIELLAQELAKLRVVLKENATLPEQDLAIAQVSKAFLDAEKGDNSGAVKSLAGLSTLAAHFGRLLVRCRLRVA
jgi:hypothetical protein